MIFNHRTFLTDKYEQLVIHSRFAIMIGNETLKVNDVGTLLPDRWGTITVPN